jgi:hypothetical protein
MVNELSQYDIGIAFKQKWIIKYWTLRIMKCMETKDFHNYVIDINNWLDIKPIQWAKSRV